MCRRKGETRPQAFEPRPQMMVFLKEESGRVWHLARAPILGQFEMAWALKSGGAGGVGMAFLFSPGRK